MPVDTLLADDEPKFPEKGIALALSGGGYRAMVFHLIHSLRRKPMALFCFRLPNPLGDDLRANGTPRGGACRPSPGAPIVNHHKKGNSLY